MLPPEPIRRAIEERLGLDPYPGPTEADWKGADWSAAGGGLSDASVWRVRLNGRSYAIRRWWTGIEPRLVNWIAETLRSAAERQNDFIAVPLGGPGDDRWPLLDGREGRWEAAFWKPGIPLGAESSNSEIGVAVEGLARFHRSVSRLPACPVDQPSALAERKRRLHQLQQQPAPRVDSAPAQAWPELAEIARQLPEAAFRAAGLVEAVREESIGPSQPIHGDARPEHFLLEEGQLTGLIDFGAMRSGSVLVDVARLAGEIALGDADRCSEVVRLYGSAAERTVNHKAVQALDASGAVLSAANWLRWLSDPAGPGREPELVRERLSSIAARLPAG